MTLPQTIYGTSICNHDVGFPKEVGNPTHELKLSHTNVDLGDTGRITIVYLELSVYNMM
jgi:hypothetical protein